MPDRVFPVCRPSLLAQRGPVDTVESLLDLPLLHDSATEGDGSGSDWRSWLNHGGWHDAPCGEGQRFSDAGPFIHAALLRLRAPPPPPTLPFHPVPTPTFTRPPITA